MSFNLGTLFFRVRADTKDIKKAEGVVKKSTGRMSKSFSRLGVAIGAALSFEALRRAQLFAEQMLLLDVRLKAVSDTTAQFTRNQQALLKAANETGQSFSDIVVLFEKIKLASKELGATNDQILQLTESLNKLGVIGGSSVTEIRFSMRQLGQAFAGGIVRAEEFNSIIENTPAIARAIAAGMDKGVGGLRKMVIEGRLLAEDVFKSLLSQQDKIDERFEKIPRTSARAWQAVENQAGQALKQIAEEIDSTEGISGAFDHVAAGIPEFVKEVLIGAQGIQAGWQIAVANIEVAWLQFAALWASKSVVFEVTAIRAKLAWLDAIDGMKKASDEFFGKLVEESKKPQGERSIFTADFGEVMKRVKSFFSDVGEEQDKIKVKAIEDVVEVLTEREKLEKRLAELLKTDDAQSLTNRLKAIEDESAARLAAIGEELKADIERIQAGVDARKKAREDLSEFKIDEDGGGVGANKELDEAAFQDAMAKFGDETAIILSLHRKRQEEIDKIVGLGIEDRAKLEKRSAMLLARDMNRITMMRIASVQGAVDSIVNLITEGNAKQSALGRAAIAVSKGLAIAQAAIALQQNIAEASKIGFPQNIPLIAGAIAQGASILSALNSIPTAPGRVNGGPAVGGFATPVTEDGRPELFEQNGRKFIIPGAGGGGMVSPMGDAGGMGGIKVNIINNGDPVDAQVDMVSRSELNIILEKQSRDTINAIDTSLATAQGSTFDALGKSVNLNRNLGNG